MKKWKINKSQYFKPLDEYDLKIQLDITTYIIFESLEKKEQFLEDLEFKDV